MAMGSGAAAVQPSSRAVCERRLRADVREPGMASLPGGCASRAPVVVGCPAARNIRGVCMGQSVLLPDLSAGFLLAEVALAAPRRHRTDRDLDGFGLVHRADRVFLDVRLRRPTALADA